MKSEPSFPALERESASASERATRGAPRPPGGSSSPNLRGPGEDSLKAATGVPQAKDSWTVPPQNGSMSSMYIGTKVGPLREYSSGRTRWSTAPRKSKEVSTPSLDAEDFIIG